MSVVARGMPFIPVKSTAYSGNLRKKATPVTRGGFFTKIARIRRAFHGDEWHPLIPSPLGERVRVRGKVMGIHPHLNPPPQGGGDIL